ncbi:hypothetical protein ACOMHN_033830 [Nucella lapillus]
MSMMRARVQGHRWVDHPAAAVMKARVPGQWVDRPAAVVMEAREQGRCWIDHPAVAGTLQYTLEEKYLSGRQKYYFEAGEERFLLYLQEKRLVSLTEGRTVPVLRRPFLSDQVSETPVLSSLLLPVPPEVHWPCLPAHWDCVDHYQDFEMVELEAAGSEFLDVERSFHSTLSRDRVNIFRIFRVQNPSLWDKYCSTRRAMTPRGGMSQDVDERKLFHGTPTLLAARGICANNIDFRRAGENTGAMFGKGSYFSAHALYSHSYTQSPDRYMFQAKVLVGRFTRGQQAYTQPPVREGLKLFDSCVDDEAKPTIFVLFDLAQSYPEYLVQYADAEVGPGVRAPSVQVPSAVSGPDVTGSDVKAQAREEEEKEAGSATRPVPRPRTSVPSAAPKTGFPAEEKAGETTFAADRSLRLRYQNPYSPASGAADLGSPSKLDMTSLEEFVKRAVSEADRKAQRSRSPDKCLLS